MSLDKLKLPDFIIADMYKDSLVEIDNFQEEKQLTETKLDDAQIEALTPEQNAIKFLGKNEKNIVVVVNDVEAKIINDAELQFLTKILTACNLHLADIAIVNSYNQVVEFTQLKEQFSAAFVLLLGVEPVAIKLPFSVPPFQVQPFSNTTIFHTPPLSAMLTTSAESRSLKMQLWSSLKTAFKL